MLMISYWFENFNIKQKTSVLEVCVVEMYKICAVYQATAV